MNYCGWKNERTHMQTWRDVFRRKDEQQNLKHVGFCLLVVVLLVTGSFALAGLQFMFEASRQATDNLAITNSIEVSDLDR